MVPRDGHMEGMSAPCKQIMCWQCHKGHFHVEFVADVGDTWIHKEMTWTLHFVWDDAWIPLKYDEDIVYCGNAIAIVVLVDVMWDGRMLWGQHVRHAY